jgi:hypothetical protein
MKRLTIFTIAILLIASAAFAAPATKVKLGFVNSMTGPEAPIGSGD